MEDLQAWLADKPRGAKGDLAKRAGITAAYLSDILAGRKRPQIDITWRIEKATDGAVPMQAWARE